ncbi:YjbF family lipoprotein [Photobacterium damselae subsp. damselae]|uniref:YjbF family lipoprotein n=1 Tax=Photobacterium damselae TaxID=38293 RepID=UPI000A2F9731|nr:YjbF family lipoprotein [Photobacterium damselae]ARR49863.1 lipoprotein YmcC precursor [Photobacterium damselae subsp. damselae]QAY35591.1 YjbF family lipoprotein [Photobacterium damselae subsp. damselae]
MNVNKLVLPVALLLLSGCSQRANDANDTVKLAIFGTPDVVKTAKEIKQLPYASTYVRIGDHSQIFMVLALAETKYLPASRQLTTNIANPLQLKWMSSDNGMLVTENGRIVKTLNLQDGNLLSSDSKQTDPLLLGLQKSTTPLTWQRTISWQPGYHMWYHLSSTFHNDGIQLVDINGQQVKALQFSETVKVKELDRSYQNTFWLDPINGKVIKSQQYPAPGMPLITMTILKSFA